MKPEHSRDAAERRRGRRVAVSLRVFYQHHGDAWLVEAEAANLSSEGLFVATVRPPLAVGTEVVVSMRLGDGAPMMVRGQVTWANHGIGTERGMGLRFIDLEPEHAEEIRACLATHQREEPEA